VRAAYTAENRSLAALEVLANAEDKDTLLSARWSIIPVRIDPDLIYAPEKFPADWRSVPPSDSTRRFGADWVTKGTSAVLRVPSIVTLGEFCYVLNPLHPDFAKLDIGRAEPFTFDARTA
jgi:RES domain-containing protein